ncbi:MAG: hypothetical protein IT463_11355 [Planctomycetes bacterium]|nr:hypothetical protein [Planctomycetota bacterium]
MYLRALKTVLCTVVVAALLAALGTNARAEVPAEAEARSAELRSWFEGLSPQRQELLKRRLKVLKRLGKEDQETLLKRAESGEPLLTEPQRQNLRKVKQLDYLQRVRLYTLMRDLEMLRKAEPARVREAMAMPAEQRNKTLGEMIQRHRQGMFLRSLPADQQAKLEKLPPEQRGAELRRLHQKQGKERMEQLSALHPRVAELRAAAAQGDAQARAELRQVVADLTTLDLLLQRLPQDRREKVLANLKDVGIEKAAELVRKELRSYYSEQERRRNPDERGEGPRNPERRMVRGPEDNRPRNRD